MIALSHAVIPPAETPGFNGNGNGNPHPSGCPVTGCDCDCGASTQAEHQQTIEQLLIDAFGAVLVEETPLSVTATLRIGDQTLTAELDDDAVATIAAAVTPQPAPSPYLSIPEAADHLRCTRQRIDDLLSTGRLTRIKDGTRTLIERAEVEAYLRRTT